MGSNDPASRLTRANRLSVRAVVVPHGWSAAKALVENGIYDPVAIPLTFADELSANDAVLGGGWDPAVIATLEPDDTGLSASTPGPSQTASDPHGGRRPGLAGATIDFGRCVWNQFTRAGPQATVLASGLAAVIPRRP